MKQCLSAVLAVTLILLLISGCSGAMGSTEPAVTSTPQESSSEAVADVSSGIQKLSEEKTTLSIWVATLMSIQNNTESINELTAIQEYEALTNVAAEWRQASSQAAVEQFAVMIASGDYPDIILSLANYYVGGVTGALDNGVILALDDYLDEYAPNYKELVSSDPTITKEAVSDEGNYLAFYAFYDNDYLPLSGPVVRSDWLSALNLDIPVTYDDYHDVALAFKTEYGCSDPILALGDGTFFYSMYGNSGYFAGAFGVPGFASTGVGVGTTALYQLDGVVHSALLEDGYLEYLKLMNQWYKDGVISADFISNPTSQMTPEYNALIYNSQTGIFIGDAVNMNGYGEMAVDDSFALVGTPDPVMQVGDPVNPFGIDRNKKQGASASITATCNNVQLAVRWLDQWYSDEGAVLANYGIEGVAHTLGSDGVRRYTDLVLHNEKLTQQAATVLYTVTFCPTINTQQNRFIIWENDQAILDAVATWNSSTDGSGHLPGVSLTVEESQAYTNLAVTIQTYASENVALFIMGEKDFSEWDAFKTQILALGIEDCIGYYQNALDRFNART